MVKLFRKPVVNSKGFPGRVGGCRLLRRFDRSVYKTNLYILGFRGLLRVEGAHKFKQLFTKYPWN
jgi:hypothetical protein